MGRPKSLAGLLASLEVETKDWHAALSAVRKHVAPPDDLPLLSVVHCVAEPDGNLFLSATDRYTVGVAVTSIWEDHVRSGEVVEFDLTPDDVRDLQIFKPSARDNPENRLRLDILKSEIRVTEVAGMIETDADKSLTLPRAQFSDKYPDVRKTVAGGIRLAVALRERAEDEGSTSDAAVEELFTSAALIGRFDAAASSYKQPLVIQRTAEARTALLVSCGESFVGMLMPIRPAEEALVEHRGWQRGWVRRLPDPDDVPVAMPEPAGEQPQDDADGAPGPGDVPLPYVPAPDDGTVEPGDRLRCIAVDCTWVEETSEVDADASLSAALEHVRSAHGFRDREWTEAAALIVSERRARPAGAASGAGDDLAALDAEARAAGVLVTDGTGLTADDLKHGAGLVFSGA